ncbi:MAG TPA: hypothetical protein VGD60_20350 [Candidatus Acidoferrales bacterium]
MNKRHFAKFAAVLLLSAVMILAPATTLQADQILSNAQTVNLSFSVNESLTLSCTPAAVTFSYNAVAGTGTASGPISCTSTWALASTRTQLFGYAYFATPGAALADATTNVPTSEVFASMDGGAVQPCTGTDTTISTIPVGGLCSGFNPLSGPLSNPVNLTGTHTNTILLSLANLGQLSVGSYAGVLQIQLEAQ